ncbi:MAG: tRNA (N(6)-L-threonylcarbamoyladenosine(37)-C(2))-methylthiotransferase MtaB [Bacteroidales bacterium]|nr:tRNA (N(6)-L-threonylcarbamoyladenosine(37)-C(2))-methylthiotransferase MtaB [Bacteroidales bacterium]
MFPEKRKIAFYTLGCKLNFTESSYIASTLPVDNYVKVAPDENADIYVINTCTVTSDADKKCRQAIRKFIKQSPSAIIAVTGCYSQLRADEVATIPGVDLVLGSREKFDLVRYLDEIYEKGLTCVDSGNIVNDKTFVYSWSSSERTRTFIKIQDGCDYRCAYCTLPMARGRSRNASVKNITEKIKQIAANGIPEIVLTGLNIGDFGKTTGETFTELLRQIEEIEGVQRIRLSSVEPDLLTDEIIELTAGSRKIMPHFHIPLQSGSNKILGLMRRRYKTELFASRVKKIREFIPLAGIGSDVIVGFPGETDDDFDETFYFLEKMPLTYLHVFPYSDRPRTKASELPGKVSPKIKEERRKQLSRLSKKLNLDFKKRNINTINEVLFENSIQGKKVLGFTENYLKSEHNAIENIKGKIKKVRIVGINPSSNLAVELLD